MCTQTVTLGANSAPHARSSIAPEGRRIAYLFRERLNNGLEHGSGDIVICALATVRGNGRRISRSETAERSRVSAVATPCATNGVELLAAARVPIWIDGEAGSHTKTMVIDGAVTLTGSMNWTRGPAANSENLNLVSSPDFAAACATHWRERLAVSVRYERREDWCRVSRSTMQLSVGRGGDA